MKVLMMTLILLIAPIASLAQTEYFDAVRANREFKKVTDRFVQKHNEIKDEMDIWTLAIPYYYKSPRALKGKLALLKVLAEELSEIGDNWQKARVKQLRAEQRLRKYPKTYSRYMAEKWVPEGKVPTKIYGQKQKGPIYIDRLVYNGRTINNGPRNDLTVYFRGSPQWPLIAELTATNCPPGVSCPPVRMSFNSTSIRGYNAVILPKVLYCYGFKRSATIGAQVVLRDSVGNVTAPRPVTTSCIVR